MHRLGWLLGTLFLTHPLLVPFADALPLEPSKIASELKVTPQIVRVKLSDLGRFLTVRGTDLALSLAMKPELGNVRADEWQIDCKTSTLTQPRTGKSRQIPRSGVLIESLSGILSLNERRFREQVVIYPKELLSPYDSSIRNNPQCLVVNHVSIEKYLESVVNGEFNSQWAENAVEAQIIAARTYALFQMREMRKDHGKVFDVESTQKDQVYLGLDRADSKGAQLVAKTRGMIMVAKTSKNLDPIKAFYHSTCGGQTLLPEQVWGTHFAGFTKTAPCPYCAHSPSFAWDFRVSIREIEAKIKKGIKVDYHRWMLLGVSTANATLAAESHVKELIFDFVDRNALTKHIHVRADAYQARNWIDPTRMKSTLFQVEQVGRSVVFKGKGSGHGVGMCQWGAKHMGEKGFTKEQILTHYYPGAKIARLWN